MVVITIELGINKCFLLEGKGGYVLIDTAYSRYHEAFKKKVQKHGITEKDIIGIVLTHHHDDHAGFVAKLLEASGAMLLVHEKALPHLARGANGENDPSY
jgi:glyoxylase-like metal-dependent hydrolase (beta-lactamase superfamily II)